MLGTPTTHGPRQDGHLAEFPDVDVSRIPALRDERWGRVVKGPGL